MNAPYDGDRGRGHGGDPEQQYPPTPSPAPDPYLQDAYTANPYPAQDPAAQDPVTEALYDRAAHPPPPPGPYQHQQPLYQQPADPQYAPDPNLWAPAPPPQPETPSRHLPYGDDATTQFVGVNDPAGPPGNEQHQPDAFAHLFRDQQPYEPREPQYRQPHQPAYQYPQEQPQDPRHQNPAHYDPRHQPPPGTPPPGPAPDPAMDAAPTPVPQQVPQIPETAETQQIQQVPRTQQAPQTPAKASSGGGKVGSIMKSSAVMAAGTLVSRLTGFVRQLVITAALGAALLGDTYAIAMTLPTMIYILTIGGGLNSVFVPQLVRAMKEDDDGGEAYANRLLTLVMVILGALVVICVFAAPLLIRVMSVKIADDPAANGVAVTFARYCLPTIFFMGVHVVMGQILNARGRFGAMMWTPVLNNIVVIFTFGMFIWVYGTHSTSHLTESTITPEGLRLLGIGTLLGLTVQSLAMLPYLRDAGFKFRPRFDWRGHGLGKAAKLAKWTFLFVLANQAGLLVVTQLATWAGDDAAKAGFPGTGILGYNNALLIWQMPQAIITVSVMAALLPRISRSAHDGDPGAVRDDISQGLRTSAVAIVPIAFGFLALGVPMCTLMFSSSGTDGARSMGFILMAFGLGLIPFSVQYVVLRGFYAYEDTRTPFYNTVIVASSNALASALCFLVLPSRWAVVGMAASYGLAYAIGVGVAWNRLRNRLGGDLDGAHVIRTYARLAGASIPAALLAGGVGYGITQTVGSGALGSLVALLGGGIVLIAVFYVAAKRMRIEELTAMVGMVRGRLGR
ncbi:murein biosynthesis integral membrane protein MurJ [Streptomyces varsoviensis]|uniref:murein biosynthesis integral membrane protein MurJ n=1 Tax=Streptomyces varsoviensis TaxID=67373 RepID=UPI0004C4DFEA|nr:murein biosynthesis integral membrane protein MurJ [Streptomyces varsoviensis]